MGLPGNDNQAGYQNSSLLLRYAGLRDKEYFLIHGTYDDNVHYQQSMLWARVLERQDILFRQLVSCKCLFKNLLSSYIFIVELSR